jgi:hypothetical protein
MNDAAKQLPDDLSSALAALAAERSRRITAEAEAATAKAAADLPLKISSRMD